MEDLKKCRICGVLHGCQWLCRGCFDKFQESQEFKTRLQNDLSMDEIIDIYVKRVTGEKMTTTIKCRYCNNDRVRGSSECAGDHPDDERPCCIVLGCNGALDTQGVYCETHHAMFENSTLSDWQPWICQFESVDDYEASQKKPEAIAPQMGVYAFDQKIQDIDDDEVLRDLFYELLEELRRHNDYYVHQIEQLKARVKTLEDK
jgi:hypothetical protein